MQMRSVTRPGCCIGYQKIVQKGDFELYDYYRGFLAVDIYSTPALDRGNYQIRVYISNIDDGDWGAWSNSISLEKANSGVEKIKDIFKEMVKLPGEKEINNMLLPYGLYGSFEN
jgi:hypothetical protein